MNISGLPVLSIRSGDVSGSYKEWLEEFQLSVNLKTLEMGMIEQKDDKGNVVKLPKFSEKAKTLALLKSIGSEGRHILSSAGLSNSKLIDSSEPEYERVLEILNQHFVRPESCYVKTQQFVTVQQGVNEDYCSYLLRVETLSRSLGIFGNKTTCCNDFGEKIRTDLCVVLAVNGLRDKVLCRELIAKDDLNWKSLRDILRSRAIAEESVDKLQIQSTGRVKVNVMNVNRNLDREQSRRSSVGVCYECGEPGHTCRNCLDVTCWRCFRSGHLAKDCRRSKCVKCGGKPHHRGSHCVVNDSSSSEGYHFMRKENRDQHYK
jgi:hypothetical protein